VSCYIGYLQIHPAHRGQGIGTRLPAVTERAAQAKDCRQSLLGVIAGNIDAHAF
jgi:GNAT superfamily N-acetyltransferase